MRHSRRISRRTALRGMGGTLALPFLEAMARASGPGGSATSQSPPLRMAFLYVPNGVHMADWTPRSSGRDFDLPPILEPLRPVRDRLLILSGLALNPARALGDGGGDHARAMASFLTGCHPRKTDGADLQAGVSVDQVAASQLGRRTRFPSLEIGCEDGRNGGECDHGYSCAYQSNLSWRSASTPLAKQVNPRLLFDRLFGAPMRAGNAADPDRVGRRRKSVLDFVSEDARQLRVALGAADRRKFDEYFQSLREVELRTLRPRLEEADGAAKYPRPLGIPADYREHLRLMSDLLALAFRADLTRIATFVFANDGSNRSFRSIGVPDGHHDLSHHGGDPEKQSRIARINRFQVEELAYFLEKLRSIPEAGGNLLDHSMVLYGSGISDGNAHRHDDLPILLAGGGAGGRHLRLPRETPLTNLHLGLLRRMGVELDRFGDSTGPLPGVDGP